MTFGTAGVVALAVSKTAALSAAAALASTFALEAVVASVAAR